MQKRFLAATLVLALALVTAGCASTAQDNTAKTPATQQAENSGVNGSEQASGSEQGTSSGQNAGTQQAEKQKVTNPDLTAKVEAETGVAGANIYESNGVVNAAIVMEKGTTADSAKVLAQKYLEQIKSQYSGKRINVQVVAGGENLASLEYQPE